MLNRLVSEIGPRPLGLARIIIGCASLLRSIVAGQALIALTKPETLRAPYLDWLPDPSAPLAIGILTVWVISGVLFVLGWRVAITGTLLLLSIAATLAIDQQTYSNHLYLMSWLVLLLTLARAGSGINIRRTETPVVLWPVLLIMMQLSIVYGFSALTKLNDSFLSGEVLAAALGRGLLAFPEALRTPRFLIPVATLAVFVELFIAVFIWRARFRPAAFVLGFGLHVAITLLMADTLQLLVFSLEMLALYPLFLSRERLEVVSDGLAFSRRLVRRMRRLDLLQVLDLGETRNGLPLQLKQGESTAQGFRALTLAFEHLVPTLWIAPLMRMPGVRQIGERWFRNQTDPDRMGSEVDSGL